MVQGYRRRSPEVSIEHQLMETNVARIGFFTAAGTGFGAGLGSIIGGLLGVVIGAGIGGVLGSIIGLGVFVAVRARTGHRIPRPMIQTTRIPTSVHYHEDVILAIPLKSILEQLGTSKQTNNRVSLTLNTDTDDDSEYMHTLDHALDFDSILY